MSKSVKSQSVKSFDQTALIAKEVQTMQKLMEKRMKTFIRKILANYKKLIKNNK